MNTFSIIILSVITGIFIVYIYFDTKKINKKLDLVAKKTSRYRSSEILYARAKNHGENTNEIEYQNRGKVIINNSNFIRLVKKGIKTQ